MDHLALRVDARRARDKQVATITILNRRTALERHTIIGRRTQVITRIEERNLPLLQPTHGIGVHRYHAADCTIATLDTRAGDVVSITTQTALVEKLSTCAHQTRIVIIDVLNVEPRANAVVRERTTLLVERGGVALQNITGLLLARCTFATRISRPNVQIFTVLQCVRSSFRTLDQPQPQSHLRAIERGLLNHRQPTSAHLLRQQRGLVCGVAHQPATEHHGHIAQPFTHLVQRANERIDLLAERSTQTCADHQVILGRATLNGKLGQLHSGAIGVGYDCSKIHLCQFTSSSLLATSPC